MSTFKEAAYQILKEAGKPLHYREITKIALARGLIKTAGNTPEASMNAMLIMDIITKKEESLFVKVGPSTFGLKEKIVVDQLPKEKISVDGSLKEKILSDQLSKEEILFDEPPKEKNSVEKTWIISKNVSTKQKGNIAEARIAELVMLYGSTTLSCYKPITDDEGIDLIVKEKGSLKTMYIQIKSRFGDDTDKFFASKIKNSNVLDNYSIAFVFCFFDTKKGDLWDFLWFVPGPDFIKLAKKLEGGKFLGFDSARHKKEEKKWDNYLIDKRDLANQIIAQMKRI